jgi:predicted nucleotidyltransferase
MPMRSWRSPMARWADPARVEGAVRDFARDLRAKSPSVVRVLWYGSWITGTPTPSSDVDLCIVLRTDERRPRERVPEFLPTRFPVSIDLVVLTEAELRELAARSPSWHRAIMAGRDV